MGLVNKIMAALNLKEESNLKSHHFIYPMDKTGKKRTGQTICVLQYDSRIFHGMSTCSEEDQFCKKTGRQLALERAIKKAERYAARKAQV